MSSRKGYKAMYNGKCLNQQYEVGKIYQLVPNVNYITKFKSPVMFEIKCNVLGFHYCRNVDDVVYYYDIKDPRFELYEIENLNPIYKGDCDTDVTDKIKIIRKIPRNEFGKLFSKSYFELVGISRIYVWKNKLFGDRTNMIKKVLVYDEYLISDEDND